MVATAGADVADGRVLAGDQPAAAPIILVVADAYLKDRFVIGKLAFASRTLHAVTDSKLRSFWTIKKP
jgi:hypothetical protein